MATATIPSTPSQRAAHPVASWSVPPHAGVRSLLDACVATPETRVLGPIRQRKDIPSLRPTSDGGLEPASFSVFPEHRVPYPSVVTKALAAIYRAYNAAFRPLVEANSEWDTDYQYARGPDGTPLNRWVQIDMVGLPDAFLRRAAGLAEDEVRETVQARVFEYENSLAMYGLHENLFANGDHGTAFDRHFRASLDALRRRYGRPIALLAVTEPKYEAMRESEFGMRAGEALSDAQVQALSGFDTFFGPGQFLQHVSRNGGTSEYLLYARTSLPTATLRKPGTVFDNRLLENDTVRRMIKANALTFNVDNPAWGLGDPRRINHTKAWMALLGIAHPVYTLEDISSEECSRYLLAQGIDPSSETVIRMKPMQASYGCYEHLRGLVSDRNFNHDIRRELARRGPYVLQPELRTPVILNKTDGQLYTYMDRNFYRADGKIYQFMGGFRIYMPMHSREAKRGENPWQ